VKTYWGSGGIAPPFLDLGIRWRWVVSFTPRPLYSQGKSPWQPLDRRLGGSRSDADQNEILPTNFSADHPYNIHPNLSHGLEDEPIHMKDEY